MKTLSFIKLSERWFVDIPWDGSVEDLQMVAGADMLLDAISFGNRFVTIGISNIRTSDDDIELVKIESDEMGGYYDVKTDYFSGTIWLCNVTLHVLGEFPDTIYIKMKKG
jgi:hypothetical protein